MHTKRLRALTGLLALLIAAILATPAATAADRSSTKPRAKSGRDSGETVSERERRLYRECRGRPNAGACEGYAR